MPVENAGVRIPQGHTGRDIDLVFLHQGQRPGQAREHGDIDNAQGQHSVERIPPQTGHQHEGQQQRRKGQQDIAAPHDDGVGQPTLVAGDEAQGDADDDGDDHDHQSADQRRPSAVNNTGKDVTARLVAAQPVGRRGLGQDLGQVLGVGVIGRNDGSQDTHQQDRHQQHKGHRDHRGEEFAHVLALGLVQRAVPNECTEHTLPSLFHADSGVQDSIEDVHHQIDT